MLSNALIPVVTLQHTYCIFEGTTRNNQELNQLRPPRDLRTKRTITPEFGCVARAEDWMWAKTYSQYLVAQDRLLTKYLPVPGTVMVH
jgi:hypothetical protein